MQRGRSQDTYLTQTGENVLTMMFLVCPSPSYGFPVTKLCCDQCHLERLVEEDHICRSLVLELLFKLKNLEGEVGAIRICMSLHNSK